MAIKFAGAFEVRRTPEEVYDFLTDPNKFAPLLPEFRGVSVEDADALHRQSERGYFLHQRNRGREDALVGSRTVPSERNIKDKAAWPGETFRWLPAFDLAVAGGGTKVVWEGEAQVFGRLTSVAGGLLEPLGKKQVQKLIDGLQAALHAASGGTL